MYQDKPKRQSKGSRLETYTSCEILVITFSWYGKNLYWLSLALINIGELCTVHNQVPKAKVDKMLLWPNLWGQSFSVTVLCRPAWMRISSCSSATAWGDQSLLWRHLSLQPTPNSCHHNRFESHNCVNINVTHKNSRDIDIPNIGNSTIAPAEISDFIKHSRFYGVSVSRAFPCFSSILN